MTNTTSNTLRALALGTALVLSTACATAPMPVLSARPGANQQLIYEDGAEKIVSMHVGSIVSIRMSEPMGGRSTFQVAVANQSTQSVLIAPEVVSVTQYGRSLKVFSYEEVARIEREQAESARASQMALSMLSSMAPMAGIPMTSLQTSLQTAQRTMSTAVSAGLSKQASTHELNLKELAGTALKKNTLFPEQMGGGVVYTEKLVAGPVSVRVQVADDVHTFEFGL